MLKSVSSILLYVSDIKKSSVFYKKLGFEVSEDKFSTFAKLNWFKIYFVDEKKAYIKKDSGVKNKGAGVFVYIKVDNVDKAYKAIIKKGLKPSSTPTDLPWGNREFAIKDPDGYKFVFDADQSI